MIESLWIMCVIVFIIAIWRSKAAEPVCDYLEFHIKKVGNKTLSYLFDCDFCKAFWMCLAGAIYFQNLWLLVPSYAFTTLALHIMEEYEDD